MMLRAPAVVPPMVLLLPLTRMARSVFPISTFPVMSRPMMFPATRLDEPKLIPSPSLPAIMFPALAVVQPIVLLIPEAPVFSAAQLTSILVPRCRCLQVLVPVMRLLLSIQSLAV